MKPTSQIDCAANELRAAYEHCRTAWGALNAGMDAATTALGEGRFTSWAGEFAVRWIPADIAHAPELAHEGNTYGVAGVLADAALLDLPSHVRAVADRYGLADLIDAAHAADRTENSALRRLASTHCESEDELVAKYLALREFNYCGLEMRTVRDALRSVADEFDSEYGELPDDPLPHTIVSTSERTKHLPQ